MYLLTQRAIIQSVPRRWAEQYPEKEYPADIYPDAQATLKALEALNTDTCSKEDVDAIIGNSGWTYVRCDECGEAVDSVIVFGSEDDEVGPHTAVCGRCVGMAAKLFGEN